MVANLSQLHDSVHQRLCATFTLESVKSKKRETIGKKHLLVLIHFKALKTLLSVKFLPNKVSLIKLEKHDPLLLTFLSFSDPSVSKTPLACMCLYKTLCRADMSHFITYSTCKPTIRERLKTRSQLTPHIAI